MAIKAQPQSYPLTDDHLAILNHVLSTIPVHLDLAEKCQQCGIDTSGQIAALTSQREYATAAKRLFFPNHP